MKYVIDPSVAIRWFLRDIFHPHADQVLKRLIQNPEQFAVPELFLYEMLALLYRHHPHAGEVFASDVDRLLRSGVLRYPMTEHIYGRARRFIAAGLTGFDAVYPALAEEIGGWWITFDSKAHRRIEEGHVSIDLAANPFQPSR